MQKGIHFQLLMLSLAGVVACSAAIPDDERGNRNAGGSGSGAAGGTAGVSAGGTAGVAGTVGAGGSVTGSGGTVTGSGGTVTGSGGTITGSGGVAGTTGTGGTLTVGGASGMGGSGGVIDPGPTSGGGEGCNDADPLHTGTGTFYYVDAGSVVNCSYALGTEPPYWVAMNTARYENSAVCGACLEVQGPLGSITARVVDRCPDDAANIPCQSNEHLDISSAGFAQIANPSAGNVAITWRYVPCAAAGNVEIFTKGDSTIHWMSLRIDNHRYRIQNVEYYSGGSLTPFERQQHNMWNVSGAGLGPLRIRVTDIYGHWIEKTVTLTPGGSVSMDLQFPAC